MTIESFYDHLAPYYKYIYADWEASVRRQAAALHSVIREFFDDQAHRILDVACGIGTQSIGLAALGYDVTAADLSAAEVALARDEAARRGLHLEFHVGDMRALDYAPLNHFDVVIACDNAVPHLSSDDDILLAFQQFYARLRTGGGCLISVRDYAAMDRTGLQLVPRGVRPISTGRVAMFDVWEFDGDYYDLNLYVVEDSGTDEVKAQVMRSRYYCVSLATLEQLMRQAGFQHVQTLRDRFFQPLVIGLKGSEREDV